MGLTEWAAKNNAAIEANKARAASTGTFEGIALKPDSLRYKGTSGPVFGATAHVETAADVRRRITATRVLTIGVFALAAKKQVGNVYLTVEHPDYGFVVEIPVKKETQAREFAAKINNAAKRAT
jgi:pectate lyase